MNEKGDTSFSGISEVVVTPEKRESGIYGPDGKLLLAAKADSSGLDFDTASLKSALKDLHGFPYTFRSAAASRLQDWGVFSAAFSGKGTFTWTGNWSPNAGPVGGCYTEWAPQLNKPHFGSAEFVLLSIQVNASGEVRVIGTQSYGALNTAAGIVIP